MRKMIHLAVLLAAVCTAGAATADEKQWTEVRIATEGGFVPWNYTNADGTLGGFEIDLANDLCKRMNVKCTITAQAFDSMIPSLNSGKFDAIIDDIAITPKRQEVIAFSVPYAALCYTFATLKDSDLAKALPPPDDNVYSLDDPAKSEAPLKTIADALKDKTIGTLAAGTSVNFVQSYLSGSALMRQYKTPQARDLDLVAGRVDAIVGSKDSLLATSKKAGNETMTIAGPCFSGGVVGKGSGVGLRKDDTTLKAMFDKAIQEAQADGTIARLSTPVFGFDVTPH